MLSATYARRPCQRSFPGFVVILLGALCLLLAACASPVSVSYADPKVVHRELTSNVLSTGRLSGPTEIVLHLHDLKQRYDADPEGAIRELHTAAVSGDNDPDVMFALAETSFQHAEAIKIAEPTRKRAYYLAATIYALAYLFPDDPAARLSPFDPRFRQACDLYNRSLTLGFAAADRQNVDLRSGSYTLP